MSKLRCAQTVWIFVSPEQTRRGCTWKQTDIDVLHQDKYVITEIEALKPHQAFSNREGFSLTPAVESTSVSQNCTCSSLIGIFEVNYSNTESSEQRFFWFLHMQKNIYTRLHAWRHCSTGVKSQRIVLKEWDYKMPNISLSLYYLYVKMRKTNYFLQKILSIVITFIFLKLRDLTVWKWKTFSRRQSITLHLTCLLFWVLNLILMKHKSRDWCLIEITLKIFPFLNHPFHRHQSFFNAGPISHLSNTAVGPGETP